MVGGPESLDTRGLHIPPRMNVELQWTMQTKQPQNGYFPSRQILL
jgi:hypothetical protein